MTTSALHGLAPGSVQEGLKGGGRRVGGFVIWGAWGNSNILFNHCTLHHYHGAEEYLIMMLILCISTVMYYL